MPSFKKQKIFTKLNKLIMNLKQTLTTLVVYLLALNGTFAQTYLIDEEFDVGTTIPTGWIGNSVSISTNNSCTASPQSVAFNGLGDALITPKLADPQELKFLYLRSSNTAAWTLNVQYSASTSGPWTTLSSISDATNSECLPLVIDLSAFSDIYIRFVDARASGAAERYIDNVVVSQRSPLSVSLLDFTAKAVDNSVKLDWSTAQEKDNSHFDIERSLDGQKFIKIAEIKANNTPSVYQVFDAQFYQSAYLYV